ncbi:hypothetical protein HDU77_000131 [Chytriomyces hyalinus]|nr:hypothetical protein HDU77_000131 [Chytriomyces hyalinus]
MLATTAAAVVCLLSPLVSALATLEAMDVYAVTPLSTSATVYKQGSANAVQWTIANAGSVNTTNIVSMDVWLGTGSGNNVNNLYQINTLPYPATTCFEWIPASNLTTSDNYTIIWQGMDSKGTLLSYNFCTWFKVGAASSADVVAACPAGSTGAGTQLPTSAPVTTVASGSSVSGTSAAASASASAAVSTTTIKSDAMSRPVAAIAAGLVAFLF